MAQTLDISTLEQWVGEDGQSLAFALLALRYLEQGNGEKALQIVQKGLEVFPNYPFGHFVAGMCYYNKKDLTEAKNHLDIAVTYDPINPRAWQLLTEINQKLELNLLADDCRLRLRGIDGFSPAITEQSSEGEPSVATPQEAEPAIPDLLEEIPDLESAESQPTEEELNLEELFDDSANEEETVDVDEIFKEAVGDLEGEESEETPDTDSGVTQEEITDSDKSEPTPATEGDEFSNAMDSFFSNLEEQETAEEAIAENQTPEKPKENTEPSSEETGEDLFDFSQAVEEFLSEREEEIQESAETAQPPKAEDKGTSEESFLSDESEFIIDLDESESSASEDTEVSKPPILSPTLGEIYISQGRFQEAIHVFEQLLQQDPDNPHFKRKIREIQNLIDKQKNLET